MIWAVIMAGGAGTRFWPLSRQRLPKQLLPIVSDRTMIEETVLRLSPMIPPSRILVITGKEHQPLIRKILRSVPSQNIIAEPCARNTAPCLGLAAAYIQSKDPNALFVALPADHLIREKRSFQKHLKVACDMASQNTHVVFGIPPSLPHTGYGYIECDYKTGEKSGVEIFKGLRFVEKPSLRVAQAFLRSGKYFWNSGMFVWKLSFFMKQVREYMPEMSQGLEKIVSEKLLSANNPKLAKIFSSFPNISIDYGLMQHIKELAVIKGRFDWSDVGSWVEAGARGKKDISGNSVMGDAVLIESSGNIIRGEKRLIAMVGIKDTIIVDTRDALLVCRKDQSQEVKRAVDELRRRKANRYL